MKSTHSVRASFASGCPPVSRRRAGCQWLLALLLCALTAQSLCAQTVVPVKYSNTITYLRVGNGTSLFSSSIVEWEYGVGLTRTNYTRNRGDQSEAAWDNEDSQGYEWTWDAFSGWFFGATFSTWATNRYYNAALPGWETTLATATNFFIELPPDLTVGAQTAPNGTTGQDWADMSFYYRVTNTYSTTSAIRTDGPPGSTNEHFYRVNLSLQYDTGATIPLAMVQSYLSEPVDADGNVYLWLKDHSSFAGRPVFKYATPSYYSYSVEPNQAQHLSTLLISTIRRGGASTWPGSRPDGMAQHMGFPSDEGYFSDDQLALDYILNSPLASAFTSLINATLAARGYPVSYEKDQSRGQVGSLTADERKYMVMLLLARSTNPDPPAELDDPTLDLFIGTNFVYRLVNEFGIEAAGHENKFGHDVAGKHLQRKRA